MEKQESKVPKSRYVPTAEFYSQVIDSMEDYSIFTLDNELKVNSWNSGSTKLFQYEVEEIIGKPFDLIFTEEDKNNDTPNLEIAKALKEGKATDNRWHIRKDGSKFYAYGLVYPMANENGEPMGYVKILRDLTERKNSEKFAKDMEELSIHKESILFILSHDLRSPLTGIIGTAEYMKSNIEKMETAQAKEMLGLLHETAKDELNLLDYLVEWARIKYASEAFAPAMIVLSESVKKAVGILNEMAVSKNITINNEIGENITVFADAEMVFSVIQNLISNAITHIISGGVITLSAERKEDKIVVKIKDMGKGMTKEVQKKLFTPQITTLFNASKEDKNAGIELLLANGYVERNGGEIWVESIEGEGPSFYFTMPVKKNAGQDVR
ncbi:MAG: PAS domain-containing sensor histidine kinase [Bacteroidota bacterium]